MGVLCFFRQFKQILLITLLLPFAAPVLSQVKIKPPAKKPVAQTGSLQLRDFTRQAALAGVQFSFPKEFKETISQDTLFNYAMELPEHEFEIWFLVKSQKKDWQNYLITKNDPIKQTPNPDTAYIALGLAQTRSLAADTGWVSREISQDVLTRFNANAGKSYLLSLPDRPETKGYKYALLLAISKDHTGTIIAVCFTNDKNSEFFRNVNGISRYLRFVEKL